MNPLVNVLLGVMFLRERLRPWQIVSVVLAVVGVAVLTVWDGQFPWIPIILALSTAFYALLRKIAPIDSLLGVAVETLFMAPFAMAYLAYLFAIGRAQGNSMSLWGLLMLSGPATSIPLLLFGGAARRLQLSTLGFVQYLTPTLQFLLAVLAFGEPFSTAQVISFSCIWIAIAIYSVDSFHARQETRIEVMEPD
jgi:chloramphenicol-sensitive protein RarD